MIDQRRSEEPEPPAFTYPDVGATAPGRRPPAGWHVLRHDRVVGRGPERFAQVREQVLSYVMQRGAGLDVEASTPRAAPGTSLRLRFQGIGRLLPALPCRVVYVLDSPTVAGFAYGTLPGHPESGEELFAVELRSDGAVSASVYAFSRPGNRLVALGGPFARMLQNLFARRYLAAVTPRDAGAAPRGPVRAHG
ncbi:DUF1990 family protein [Tsukamurella soli]|uniref:DUF1990 family protein n=1 Tax=Tsukamurella soli TaxID=644556 RepID=UPI0031E708EE